MRGELRPRRRRHAGRALALGTLVLLAPTDPAVAQSASPGRDPAAKHSPRKAPTKPRKAYGVRWEPSLDAALARADRSGNRRRPVLWFRVLGELRGKT